MVVLLRDPGTFGVESATLKISDWMTPFHFKTRHFKKPWVFSFPLPHLLLNIFCLNATIYKLQKNAFIQLKKTTTKSEFVEPTQSSKWKTQTGLQETDRWWPKELSLCMTGVDLQHLQYDRITCEVKVNYSNTFDPICQYSLARQGNAALLMKCTR